MPREWDGIEKDVVAEWPVVKSFLVALQHVWLNSQLAKDIATRWDEAYDTAVHASLLSLLALDGGRSFAYDDEGWDPLARRNKLRGVLRSIAAGYDQLRRSPTLLTASLVQESAQVLGPFLPARDGEERIPSCLQDRAVMVLQNKWLKSPSGQRKAPVGEVVAAVDGRTGMVLAIGAGKPGDPHAEPLPETVEQLRSLTAGRRVLYIGEGGFCDWKYILDFTEHEEDFLVRYRRAVRFEKDENQSVRQGKTDEGQKYTEEWGWLRRAKSRVAVRRIVVASENGESPVTLVSSLVDPDRYPAGELFTAYHQRWKVEAVMTDIADTYRLGGLLGYTYRVTVLQAASCFVFYNALHLLGQQVAAVRGWPPRAVSLNAMFRHILFGMGEWEFVLGRERIVRFLCDALSNGEVPSVPPDFLSGQWVTSWLKMPWLREFQGQPANG